MTKAKPKRGQIDKALKYQRPIVIGLAQQKGGVGKTFLTRTIMEYFAMVRGKRTCGFDMDPQCSMSKLYLDMDTDDHGARPPVHPDYDPDEMEKDPNTGEEIRLWDGSNGRCSTGSFYLGTHIAPYRVQRMQLDGELFVLPGDAKHLMDINELETSKNRTAAENRIYEHFLHNLEVLREFDVIVIDTPPTKSLVTKAVLRACTHLIIPVAPQQQCMDGLREMMGLYRNEQIHRPDGEPLHLVCYQWNLVKKSRAADLGFIDSFNELPAFGNFASPIQIPDRAAIAERDIEAATPRSIFDLPIGNDVRKIVTDAMEYIEQRIAETSKSGEGRYHVSADHKEAANG